MAPVKTADRPRGTILGSVQAGLVTFAVRAVPLPESVTAFLIANASTLKRLQRDRRLAKGDEEIDELRLESVEGEKPVEVEEFWDALEGLFKAAGKSWVGMAEQVWAFGPKKVGPNILVDRTASSLRS
jgi:ribosome assembly protein 1